MRIKGPWNLEQIERFLGDAIIPARLGIVSGSRAPVVVSLWFLYRDGSLWCASNRNARVVAWLQKHPDCGFEVAADALPYRGVRGQGAATLGSQGGAGLLKELLGRYRIAEGSRLGRTLLSRAADEVAIEIRPRWVTTWDFSERMADAIPAGEFLPRR